MIYGYIGSINTNFKKYFYDFDGNLGASIAPLQASGDLSSVGAQCLRP
jgi:hypothetical protein